MLNSTKALGIAIPHDQFSKIDIDRMYYIHHAYIDTLNKRSSNG
jgi:hypothetical protein